MRESNLATYNLDCLTGLRFIAALYVFIFHFDMLFPLTFLPESLQEVIKQGPLGVNLFFVLSGFILTYSYYKRIGNSQKRPFFREFMLKRVARIYPVYLIGLVAALGVSYLFSFYPAPFGRIVWANAFLIQSYFPGISMQWYGGGSWSLCNEFFFYALFPLVLPLLLKIRSKYILLSLLSIAVVASAVPGYIHNIYPELNLFSAVYSFPALRFAEFFCGMVTALLVFKFRWKVKPAASIILVGVAAAYLMKFGLRLQGYVAHNLVIVPAIVSLLAMLVHYGSKAAFRWLASRPMVYLGKISFAFYIVQIPLAMVFGLSKERGIIAADYSMGALWFGVNLILAAVVYHLIEHPAHKFLNAKIKPAAKVKEMQTTEGVTATPGVLTPMD